MSESFSRRDALKGFAILAGAAGAWRSIPEARAADVPHLTAADPTAVALGYHEDAKKVDAKAFPTYQPTQSCTNCLQLQGNAGDAWRPCNLFPGKLVNSNGWCKVWVKKP
jgi:high potential iron-sulfur protein